MRFSLIFVALSLSAPALSQELLQPIEPPVAVAPDALAQARAAAARGDPAEALSRYLRILATDADNVAALTGAGGAALAVGDLNASVGFYARAEDLAPRDGPIKAGLASAMAQLGRAREALRFFGEAVSAGVPVAAIAADRGLAYDLVGQPKRAQADYALAMRTAPSDELTRRLALSQAIDGQRAAALTTLDPMLRRQDVAAWRTRAFVYAITGDTLLAGNDARAVLPADQAAALQPYLTRLAALKPAEKAAAVYLGRFPSDSRSAAAAQSRPQPARPTLTVDGAVLAGAARDGMPLAATPFPATLAPTTGAQFAYVNPLAATAPPPSPPPRPAPVAAEPVAAAPTRAERAAQQRADRAAAQAKIAAAASARKEREDAALAKRNPARQWVQVAGGANRNDLPKAWASLKAKWPSQLTGRTAWVMPFRFTNRLLIGPFASEDAAQDYVTERRKEGFATFRVETAAGATVDRLAAK